MVRPDQRSGRSSVQRRGCHRGARRGGASPATRGRRAGSAAAPVHERQRRLRRVPARPGGPGPIHPGGDAAGDRGVREPRSPAIRATRSPAPGWRWRAPTCTSASREPLHVDYWGKRAESEARQALALDPDLAEAHLARAAVARKREFDWDAALAASRRALVLNPNLEQARFFAAAAYYHNGYMEEAHDRDGEGPRPPGPGCDRADPHRGAGGALLRRLCAGARAPRRGEPLEQPGDRRYVPGNGLLLHRQPGAGADDARDARHAPLGLDVGTCRRGAGRDSRGSGPDRRGANASSPGSSRGNTGTTTSPTASAWRTGSWGTWPRPGSGCGLQPTPAFPACRFSSAIRCSNLCAGRRASRPCSTTCENAAKHRFPETPGSLAPRLPATPASCTIEVSPKWASSAVGSAHEWHS